MIRFDIKEGRPFTLLNLSDPQMGHAEWADDHKSSKILHRTVGTVIERSHPDLITVSGDISYGGDFEAFNYFADYMDSFGIPWAICFGNHDNRGFKDYKNGIGRYYAEPAEFFDNQFKGSYAYNGPENWKTENLLCTAWIKAWQTGWIPACL